MDEVETYFFFFTSPIKKLSRMFSSFLKISTVPVNIYIYTVYNGIYKTLKVEPKIQGAFTQVGIILNFLKYN
jgi:hypothetical protein